MSNLKDMLETAKAHHMDEFMIDIYMAEEIVNQLKLLTDCTCKGRESMFVSSDPCRGCENKELIKV